VENAEALDEKSEFVAYSEVMRKRVLILAVAVAGSALGQGTDGGRPLRELYTDEFPMDVAGWELDWEGRREQVKSRVMLAAGLWPMPEKTPLNAVVHGRVEREDYTIDRVFFESFPGHYVTGSLYLPKPLPEKPMPGVLCPHGHWPNGRFMDAGADSAGTKEQLKSGAETFVNAARSPLQARCVHLARMGCAVFHWDTLGQADSVQIPEHRSGVQEGLTGSEPGTWGLYSVMADQRLQTNFGLQTWNSVRALDFLETVPGVDKERLAVTGASGGATQTMMLTAIDDRVAASFPCVMVSTAMQGGCTCENAHHLRVGQGNIDIAAAAAPRPLGMTTADDWTIDLATKGFPDLQALYRRIGKPDHVQAFFGNQFKHNYNQVSRAEMYAFMKRHLKLGAGAIQERDFEFSGQADLTVWTAEHPAPTGDQAGKAHEAALMKRWSALSEAKIKPLLAPKNENEWSESVLVVGEAWRMMVGRELPQAEEVEGGVTELRHKPTGEKVPVKVGVNGAWNGQVRLVLNGVVGEEEGVAKVMPTLHRPEAERNAMAKRDNKELDLNSWQGWSGYTYGYNPALIMRRVHDVLTVIAGLPQVLEAAGLRGQEPVVTLVGEGEMAAVAALAAMIAGPETLQALEVKPQGFRFAKLTSQWDTGFVPGAVKYGDLPAVLGLCAPIKLSIENETVMPEVVAMYGVTGAGDGLTWRH
jgi:hypothetical protein